MEFIEPSRANEEEGNTVISSSGVKKQGNQCKNWIFVEAIGGGETGIEPEALALRKKLLTFSKTFIFSAEKGETGYLHFQGRFSLIEKMRLTELKKIFSNTAHLEPEKNKILSIEYCKKDKTHIAGPWTDKAILRNSLRLDQLYPWQRQIVEMCKVYADDRTVNWFWEPDGKVGKSAIARFILDNVGQCLYVDGGRKEDIAQYVATSKISEWDNPIMIFNIPRSKTLVSYSAIEALKDGVMFSQKYESGMIRFNSPHIIIFANFEPDEKEMSKISADRWKITKIEKS